MKHQITAPATNTAADNKNNGNICSAVVNDATTGTAIDEITYPPLNDIPAESELNF